MRLELGILRNEPRYWLTRRREAFQTWVAWHVAPRWLVYWCAVRLMSHATTGKWGLEDSTGITCIDALKRWEE